MQAAVPHEPMRPPGATRRFRTIFRLSIVAVVSLLFVFGAHAALALWVVQLEVGASAGTGWISVDVDGEPAFVFTCCDDDDDADAECDSIEGETPECRPPSQQCEEESAARVTLTHTGSIPAVVYLQLLVDGGAGAAPLCAADLPGLTVTEDGGVLRFEGAACELLPGAASSVTALLVPRLDPGDSRTFRLVLDRPHELDGLAEFTARFIAIQWTDAGVPIPDLDADALGGFQDASWPADPYGDDDDPAGRGFWFGADHPVVVEVVGGNDDCEPDDDIPGPVKAVPGHPMPSPVEPDPVDLGPIDTPPPPDTASAPSSSSNPATTTTAVATTTTAVATTTTAVATTTTTAVATTLAAATTTVPATTTTAAPTTTTAITSTVATTTTEAPVTTTAVTTTTTAAVAPAPDPAPVPVDPPAEDAPPPAPDPNEGDPVANDPKDTGLIGGVIPIEPPDDNAVTPPESPARTLDSGRRNVE